MSQNGGDRSSHNQPLDLQLDDSSSKPPSNRKLLCIAFVSFQSFAILQLGAAIWAGSEAMLGDSIAMMIDSLAYLFNMVAERQKEVYATKLRKQYTASSTSGLESFAQNKMVLEYRKYTYQLELIPPLVSITTLLILTVIVLKEAIHSLILDFGGDDPSRSDPDVNLMAIFSAINLVLDGVNVGCFASANHALGYKTQKDNHESIDSDTKADTTMLIKPYDDSKNDDDCSENVDVINVDDLDKLENDESCSCPTSTSDTESLPLDEPCPCPTTPLSTESPSYGSNDSVHDCFLGDKMDDDATNLNMCSAYTHVFADTIRSFCVVTASLLAKFTEAVTPEIADASAAVVVSILIFLSIFPLIGGMIQTFNSLREVNQLLKEDETGENVDEEDQVELLGLVHE
eukprot:jgi/Psemu1/302540/fgenesh1_kg.73_\